MADNVLQQKIFPYDGSFDATKHPLLIAPTDFVDADNIIYTTYSTKKKRPGITEAFSKRPSGNRKIMGGIDFHRRGQQREVWYDGKRIYAADSAGNVDDITGDFVLPIDETVTFTVFSGLLFIFFGGETTRPKYWTMQGKVQDMPADCPNAAFGRVWLNSLWVPDPSVPGRILKSKTGEPLDFTTGDAQALDLDVNDGDPDGLNAIFPPHYGFLYVAKRLSLYRVKPEFTSDGDLFFSYLKISDGIGCLAHNAAVAVEDTIIFPSHRGIHTISDSANISGISQNFLSRDFQPRWKSDVNFARARFMQAVYDVERNSYILIFPAVGRNFPSDVWGFSTVAGKWYRWRDYNQSSIWRYVSFSDKSLRVMVGSQSGDFGYIDEEARKDYDKKIALYVQSGIIAPSGAPGENFNFIAISPIFVPQLKGSFSITYKLDGKTIETLKFDMLADTGEGVLGQSLTTGRTSLGGIPQVKLDRVNIMGHGQMYELFIEHTPLDDEDFELLGIIVEVDQVQKRTGTTEA